MNDWNEGQILFDDLQLEKAIGRGAFGEVWRARQLSWDRDVAVKRVSVPDERRIRSLEQEAIHWLEIGLHPYVTTCYYTRRHEGAPVIVLEYASEGALDGWIKDERLLFEENAVEKILKLSLESAWGLACAHRTGLLHLDVKPANILVENGQAKITDFGIASQLGEDAVSPGTRAFASPEQLSLEEVSGKSDVFSWAVTVFVLFRHEMSWAVGPAAPEVLEDEWQLGELPLNMPEGVYRLLLRCMAEEPAERPSMEEAADTLLDILRSEFPSYEPPSKVIDRQPLTAAEYNNRAVYMHEIGDTGKADEYFRIASETAADVTVPQYNKGLADCYAGRITPAKLLEDRLNKGLGTLNDEHIVAARVLMLNGDARSIAEVPGIAAASPAAQEWLAAGAPGSLAIQEPHTAVYQKADDRENIRRILTLGGLDAFNRNANKSPVDFIVSPKRKTMMLDNDKGAVLLGGLNSGSVPWVTCMLLRDKLKLETAQFLGENAVLYLDGGIQLCDFSDPANLAFSGMPDTPEIRALGNIRMQNIESLDNVSFILCDSPAAGGQALIILDFTDGVRRARTKVITQSEWMSGSSVGQGYSGADMFQGYPGMDKLKGYPGADIFKGYPGADIFKGSPAAYLLGGNPGRAGRQDAAFCADGSIMIGDGFKVSPMIGDGFKVSPEEWGGARRACEDPDAVMPSNNTSAPIARISGSFGTTATLVRHSAEYRDISSESDTEAFEYACLWRISPYRFLAMAFDDSPATGGSVVLEDRGEFFVARVDKGDVPPPDRAEWLMMKAVSGAVAKSRRDVIEQAARDYDRLLAYGDYTIVAGIAEELRPLLESHDENALALWQRISRDFPRGNPVMAAECEAIRSPSEVSSQVRYPKPVYPAAPFSRPSSFGKIRFSYDFRGSAPVLAIANGMVPPRRFDPVDQYRLVVCEDGSDDGLFHAMVYGREGEDGRLIVGRKGVMIRVIDVRGPECVLEIIRTGIQSQEVFVRWSGHKLLMFLSGEGLFALDFDNAGGVITELPPPLIPDIIELHDVAFIGEHADELFTGENRWRICYDILPFPERPLSDPRLEDIKGMLPRKPAEKRAMLLRNGFGNLWTELILKGR